MKNLIVTVLFLICLKSYSQDTTLLVYHPDTLLRIIDLNPYFSVHVDSFFTYQLQINKETQNYFWYLKNAPVGLRIDKNSGLITFKAEKAYFISGRLKYDIPYKVLVGVQNLNDPNDKIDTSFNLVFFNTEIIPSRVKPTVSGTILIHEGETVNFKVYCETGSYPFENVLTLTSEPIDSFVAVQKCGDEFRWKTDYSVVNDADEGREKVMDLMFIGSTKFGIRDTASVKVIVRNALNYPIAVEEYNQTVRNLDRYILQLKYTFLQIDKKLKKTKNYRTGFDLTSATTSLTGTILSTSSGEGAQNMGKILPSVGLSLVPIKEAAVPNRATDQNQASMIRASIKRLEYMRHDNYLIGERDPEITKKTNKLKDELKQAQMQLIDVPLELTNDMSEEELNRYFNSPKVNKKYRLTTK